MSIKTTLMTSVAAAALFAVSAPVVSSSAEAGIKNGNDNGVTISGALVRSMQYVDNGQSNDWRNTDGGTDNSRLRILVSGKLTESLSVGGTWEANLPVSNNQGSTTTTGTGQQGTVTSAGDSGEFGFRKTEIKFSHATMGSFTIGQGSTSSDNKPSLDSTVNNNAGMSHGGDVMIYDKTGNAQTTSTGGGQFASYFGGRADRLRYDSPSVGGFKVSGSVAEDNFYDVGITYGAAMGDVTVAAAIQMRHLTSEYPNENYGGGLALKHASGLSAGAHYGKEASTDPTSTIDGSSWGVEAGYTTSSMSNLGATSFSVVYTEADETAADNFQAELVGFHVAQGLPAGVNVFAAYEVASFDDGSAATSLDDIAVFLVGTRLMF
jgi:hypothetical protein